MDIGDYLSQTNNLNDNVKSLLDTAQAKHAEVVDKLMEAGDTNEKLGNALALGSEALNHFYDIPKMAKASFKKLITSKTPKVKIPGNTQVDAKPATKEPIVEAETQTEDDIPRFADGTRILTDEDADAMIRGEIPTGFNPETDIPESLRLSEGDKFLQELEPAQEQFYQRLDDAGLARPQANQLLDETGAFKDTLNKADKLDALGAQANAPLEDDALKTGAQNVEKSVATTAGEEAAEFGVADLLGPVGVALEVGSVLGTLIPGISDLFKAQHQKTQEPDLTNVPIPQFQPGS